MRNFVTRLQSVWWKKWPIKNDSPLRQGPVPSCILAAHYLECSLNSQALTVVTVFAMPISLCIDQWDCLRAAKTWKPWRASSQLPMANIHHCTAHGLRHPGNWIQHAENDLMTKALQAAGWCPWLARRRIPEMMHCTQSGRTSGATEPMHVWSHAQGQPPRRHRAMRGKMNVRSME